MSTSSEIPSSERVVSTSKQQTSSGAAIQVATTGSDGVVGATTTSEEDDTCQVIHSEQGQLSFGGDIPESVRFQDGLKMYREGLVPRKSDAAVVAEMRESTFVHRSLGRRSAKDFYKSRRLLKEEEEEILIWRCEILQRAGFRQSIRDVRDLAEKILQKRDPTATVSPRWIDRCLYKHHPEVKARWSQQLDRLRARHGNNFNALELFFEMVSVMTA
jgi:hypothetical protein